MHKELTTQVDVREMQKLTVLTESKEHSPLLQSSFTWQVLQSSPLPLVGLGVYTARSALSSLHQLSMSDQDFMARLEKKYKFKTHCKAA